MRNLNEVDLKNVSGAGCCRNRAAKTESKVEENNVDQSLFAMPKHSFVAANSDHTQGCCR